MSMVPFKPNDYPTLGVEEEFHLIDPVTAELCPRVDDVMARLDPEMREQICYELLLCVLENRTGVFTTVDDLVAAVCKARSSLAECCKQLGMMLVAGGSHPFGSWRAQPFVDSDHYQWVHYNYNYIAHRLLAFGLHVHVGVRSDEAALYVMNEMRRWTYPLVALSANSPYYEGEETGLVSTRTHLFNCMPRSRFAPPFTRFSELDAYYEKMLAAGDITRPGDLWWCIRPQPPLGTVEFRFFDLPTDVKRLGVFAALVQAAVATYQDAYCAQKPASKLNPGFLEQNWWRAIRDGLRADIIEPETGEIIAMQTQLERLIAFVMPKAAELNCAHHVGYAREMIEQGSEAEQQLLLAHRLNGDLKALELDIAARTLLYE